MAATTFDPATLLSGDALSGGNLTFTGGTSGAVGFVKATNSIPASNVYWEISCVGSSGSRGIGFCLSSLANSGNVCAGQFAGGWDYYGTSGKLYHNGSLIAFGSSFDQPNVIGVAVAMPTGNAWWSLNDVWQGAGDPASGANPAVTGLSGTLFPEVGHDGYQSVGMTANFGATAFAGTVPTGFTAFDGAPPGRVPNTRWAQLGPLLAHFQSLGKSQLGWRRRDSGLLIPAF